MDIISRKFTIFKEKYCIMADKTIKITDLKKNMVLSCFTKYFDEVWKHKVFLLINNRLEKNEIAFLSKYRFEDSIGADLSQDYAEVKTYENTYFYYFKSKIDEKGLKLLIEDEEFYLGNIILLVNSNRNDIIKYAISYESELIFADIEIFKMNNDGLTFHWYNPPAI